MPPPFFLEIPTNIIDMTTFYSLAEYVIHVHASFIGTISVSLTSLSLTLEIYVLFNREVISYIRAHVKINC